MSEKKKRRTRRGGKKHKAKRKHRRGYSPGWHLKLEDLRRQAEKEPGEYAVKVMRGWELHLRHMPQGHRCTSPECSWEGTNPADSPWSISCPVCAEPARLEPWSLTAKPASHVPEWDWLNKAADYLGIPELDEDGESQRPTADDGLHVVLWTWNAPPTQQRRRASSD